MEILTHTRALSADLADHLAECFDAPFASDETRPAILRKHLWMLEFHADFCDWIDEGYRRDLACCLVDHWRARLSRMTSGVWRLCLYQDTAPTLAILPLGATAGLPPGMAQAVPDPGAVMLPYLGRSWGLLGPTMAVLPRRADILAAIDAHQGSLERETALALGLKPGSLRFLIDQDGLKEAVNTIRARHGLPEERFRDARATAAMPYLLYAETVGQPAP